MSSSDRYAIPVLPCPEASRVAIISDTHGRIDPRIAEVVASCDCAVHAGDVGAASVLAALQSRVRTLVAVLGNNDVEEKLGAEDWTLLRALPQEMCIELSGGVLVVVHGHRAGPASTRHAWLRKCFPAARAVVYGHSHRLDCDRTQTPWVLNPGSAGLSRTFGGPSCLVLTIKGRRWTVETVRVPPVPSGAFRRQTASR